MRQVLLMSDMTAKSYTVIVPSLPGCTSEGHTVDEALLKIKQAIETHFEKLAAQGSALPGDSGEALEVAII